MYSGFLRSGGVEILERDTYNAAGGEGEEDTEGVKRMGGMGRGRKGRDGERRKRVKGWRDGEREDEKGGEGR